MLGGMRQDEWDARYAAAELIWSRGPNRFVAQECAPLPAGDALDLAAGEGRNAIWLAGRGWRVTAVDFSRVALDKGRRLAAGAPCADTIDWVAADLCAYRPAAAGYDLALVCYLHLEAGEQTEVLRAAAAALRAGGVLVVVGHDRSNLTEGTGGPQDPAILHTAQETAAMLAGTGLRIARAERVRRPVAGPGDRSAVDMLVRAVR